MLTTGLIGINIPILAIVKPRSSAMSGPHGGLSGGSGDGARILIPRLSHDHMLLPEN